MEEAQKQLEVTRIAFIRLILNLQEENEAYEGEPRTSSCGGGSETTRGN